MLLNNRPDANTKPVVLKAVLTLNPLVEIMNTPGFKKKNTTRTTSKSTSSMDISGEEERKIED